jgi:hypothetical protein
MKFQASIVFALSLVFAAAAAGKDGSAASAGASSTASTGAKGTGRLAAGASGVAAGGGSAPRAGGGMYGSHRPAPALDPERRISEQDCTKAIVNDGGNLRCK